MKCQRLFFGKNKKKYFKKLSTKIFAQHDKISKSCLLKFLPSMLNVKHTST